jgi:Fe2+ or Zn2+ uptake regulation protein
MNTIPFLGGKNSVKDDIFSILSEEPNLSAKEIHARVKRKQGKSVTYQAVHKVLLSLIEQKMLEKNNGKYRIQKNWIDQIREHLTILEQQYQERPSAKRVLEQLKKGPVTLNLSSLTTMGVFTAELLVEKRMREEKKQPNLAYLRHAWWPLKFEPSQYILFKKMDDNNPDNRVIVTQDTPFDRWVIKYYIITAHEKNRLIIETKARWEEDLIVKGNLVIQTRYSNETLKRVDKIYQKISNLTELFDAYFVNVAKDEGFDIEMTISENPTLAKLITEKIKSYFGEK